MRLNEPKLGAIPVLCELKKQTMKNYTVEIELDTIEMEISAKNKTEARKKALNRLNRRKPSGLIKKDWPGGRKCIWIDE